MCSFCNAQTEATDNTEQSARISELRQQEQQYTFNTAITPLEENSLQTNTTWQFIKLILVLITVMACIYFIVWLLKKTTNPVFTPDPYLRKVASLNLAPGKSVYIISTPSQAFLVGTSETGVNKIGEITDKELIDDMNLNVEKQPTIKVKDFASMLSSFLPAVRRNEPSDKEESFDNHFSSAAEETREILRQRRKNRQETTYSQDTSFNGEKK